MLDRRRAERRKKATVPVEAGDAVTEYDALDSLLAEEAESRVRKAVSRLSETQREVFLLRVEQGRSYKEIADIVGTTEGAARVHYHNAMRAVKEYVSD
jgi:RNA polymerase sigma-70 factor (ECF subfamily)